VVLCILDGWGTRAETENNAIALANTPNWDRLMEAAPHALVKTSGLDVGLPEGQMGNSEVGHMNIGAGRVVMQDLPRIDAAIKDGSFATNPVLCELIDKVQDAGGTLHIMGLLSPGGVHSHQDHMAAAAKIAADAGLQVWVHGFLDGRDTPPKSAVGYAERFIGDVMLTPTVRMGTISGRYFAMDRDNNWDRIERAYNAIALAKGEMAEDAVDGIEAAYARGETDEFVAPTVVGSYKGMRDGDGLLMVNFRADRAREILTAMVAPDFDGFARTPIHFAAKAGMVEYSDELNPCLPALFGAAHLKNTLGEWLAAKGKTQLRIAETEKYAHVTFFLNGGREEVFKGEDRILVPSPKVATYDLKPEMSALEVTDKLVEAIGSGTYDCIVVNYANPDMVGHTGILDAAMKAAETVDACIGRLEEATRKAGGAMIITADHGNLEQMVDPDNDGPHTAHTVTPVPIVLAVDGAADIKDGKLSDIAPTVLDLMGMPIPKEMTGTSLLEGHITRKEGGRAAE
jgi:2,3-bisphosphoglycerate-independent phosphoglycerate mutase